MKVLFLHESHPAQFRHLAPAIASDPANQVVFGTMARDTPELPGVLRAIYTPSREPADETHPYVRRVEKAVIAGQAMAQTAFDLKRSGFRPDVVVAHTGWGPGLFIKEVFPDARFLTYIEWFYRTSGSNLGFHPDEPGDPDMMLRMLTANATFLLDLTECDWAITPTRYQADQIPEVYHSKLTVLHDGVDTTYFVPAPRRGLRLANVTLPPDAEIVTYATRGQEPYRGFGEFMRAAALVLERRPKAHVVIAGRDRVAYGAALPPGRSWRRRLMGELHEKGVDTSRLHFTDLLPYGQYRHLLQASWCHVYLTIPFVLSWSLLEAMACGAAIVGSDTAPMREIIQHGHNGLLTDFFDSAALADRIGEVLEHQGAVEPMRAAARNTIVERYDLATMLELQTRLISDLAETAR